MSVIKRYSNRKLYDTEARCYVTLDELAEMIKRGENVEIIDHLSGINLTAVTLAQIIFEQEKKVGGVLPEILLSRIIRMGRKSMNDLQKNLQVYLDPERFFADELSRRMELLRERHELSDELAERLVSLLLALPVINEEVEDTFMSEENLVSHDDILALRLRLEQLGKELDEVTRAGKRN